MQKKTVSSCQSLLVCFEAEHKNAVKKKLLKKPKKNVFIVIRIVCATCTATSYQCFVQYLVQSWAVALRNWHI